MESMAHGKEKVSNSFDVLIDSDAFVGWFLVSDAHHQEAKQIFHQLEKENIQPVITSLVCLETATVLSYRSGQSLARSFLDHVHEAEMPIIHIDEHLQQKSIALFAEQQVRGTSVIDCANVVVIRRFTIPQIFSFDKVYSTTFGVKTTT
jgi:predicted nucleic acid-binding protein